MTCELFVSRVSG